MICTVAQFNAYSGNWNADADTVALKENYLKTAEEKVKAYLGYDPSRTTRRDILSGIGDSCLYLKAKNIITVSKVIVDGMEQSLPHISLCGDHLESDDGTEIFTRGKNNIIVEYEGGWTTIPDAIQICILRIATLLLGESNGNIGISSRTYDDNTRTFIQYTDYSKYLNAISDYRVLRF